MSAEPVQIRIDHVSHRFGDTVALDDVNLMINPGELFFLLGPSGCGKSTLLRIIAGLLEPASGRVWFNDRDVTRLGTERRNAVMVFQSYALWPHMTVRENVRFGLSVRHLARDEQDRKLDEVLRLVQMQDLAARKPNELSGGQQQRVALARALAVEPACLLLDEPLSNLDAQLRQEMRGEIRRICKSSGFTTVYVTHDQKEALSVADRIAVLRAGKLAQVGSPQELYQRPSSSFVAGFVGQTNLLAGRVVGRETAPDGLDRTVRIATPAGTLLAANNGGRWIDGAEVMVSIRPEQIRVVGGAAPAATSNGVNRLDVKTAESSFLGETSEHLVLANDGRQPLKLIASPPLVQAPPRMTVEISPTDVVVLGE